MTRARPAMLIDPQQVHQQEVLRISGVPTGRDRSLADQRARLAEPGSDRPKVVTGNIDDGTIWNSILPVLEARNIIINKAERGGQFGVEHRNAMLVNADSPLFLVYAQGSADTGSTTNTVTTVTAASNAIILGVGKWSVIVLVEIILAHSASGSVQISAEIEGDEGTQRTVTNATATTGVRCAAHISRVDEADWIDGEQTLNIRARYCSSTAGTTSARSPSIIAIAKRMD